MTPTPRSSPPPTPPLGDASSPRAARILVVEDDPETAADIETCLAESGFAPEACGNGLEALERALAGGFDAITLDRMLPGLDGLDLVKRLRDSDLATPVLMVSALSDIDDRVTGLRAGGDDYLVKPFAPNELVARLEVLLRRSRRAPATETSITVGDLELDLIRHRAERQGRLIELLPMEFKLLEYLMRNAGQPLSRRMIFETVWGYYFDPGTNLIDVHMGKLRRKIDQPGLTPLFHTERGVGYMLHAPA